MKHSTEPRSALAIKREYEKVVRARKRNKLLGNDGPLMGAMQALAWALKDHAMSASQCWGKPVKKFRSAMQTKKEK